MLLTARDKDTSGPSTAVEWEMRTVKDPTRGTDGGAVVSRLTLGSREYYQWGEPPYVRGLFQWYYREHGSRRWRRFGKPLRLPRQR